MRKLVSFFIGLLIVALMLGALAVTAAIYNSVAQIQVEAYFFQPNNQSFERLGEPVGADELGTDKMRRMLVQKYITEYFYVIPDVQDVSRRMMKNSTLAYMSGATVFEQWVKGEGETIKQLAADGAFRVVRVVGDIYKPKDSDYWTVTYETRTWLRPNDMGEEPVSETGVLYLMFDDENITDLRQSVVDSGIGRALERGRDPATFFRFGIDGVRR